MAFVVAGHKGEAITKCSITNCPLAADAVRPAWVRARPRARNVSGPGSVSMGAWRWPAAAGCLAVALMTAATGTVLDPAPGCLMVPWIDR